MKIEELNDILQDTKTNVWTVEVNDEVLVTYNTRDLAEAHIAAMRTTEQEAA